MVSTSLFILVPPKLCTTMNQSYLGGGGSEQSRIRYEWTLLMPSTHLGYTTSPKTWLVMCIPVLVRFFLDRKSFIIRSLRSSTHSPIHPYRDLYLEALSW